jgi:guanylate kinase
MNGGGDAVTPVTGGAGTAGGAIARRGVLFVISSPSGAGKTTLARRLLSAEPELALSVSVTTRPKRPKEIEGRDYIFVDHPRFSEMVEKGELLEHADVFGNRYGTPRAPVERWLEQGRDVLFDVDWQGAQQLSESPLGADVVSVFILPPSIEELRRRLVARNEDAPETVEGRMAKARDEIGHCGEYAYVVVNDDLDESERGLRAILAAERLRRTRRVGLAAFLSAMR